MSDVVLLLRAAMGDLVVTDQETLDAMRSDKSGHRSDGAPLALVNARSVADVQAVMRIATKTATPVVTRGAGTGLAGGAIATGGEIVLSTLAMNRILEISTDDALAVVEPGIINGDFNDALAEHGMWFVPDPASRAISTVGGNIATNAGGLLCAKYGVTRDSVLGLKVVLADGRLISVGRRTVKGVTGYDMTALMIGSEGTLGIIVEATVKLRQRTLGRVVTMSAHFDSVETAAAAATAIGVAGVQPAVMELIAESGMAALSSYLELGAVRGSQLLVQTDGAGAQAEADAALAIIRQCGGIVEIASDEEEGERLFAIRRSFYSAVASLGHVLIEDICVPRTRLAEMFAVIADIEHRYGIVIPTVAHAGDGNLHPNFILESPEVPPEIWAAADELFLAALRLGGTLTGEHGVGLLKRRWMTDELGEDQLELQRSIKAAFDPLGILNPGKVF